MRSIVRESVISVLAAVLVFAAILVVEGALVRGEPAGATGSSPVLVYPTPDPHP